jgi:glucose/arabinose dehydrogenase
MKLVTRSILALFLLSLALPAMLASAQNGDTEDQVAVELVMDGLAGPLFATHAGDERMFIVEKGGTIRIMEDGQLLDEPFLDISDRVHDQDFEQGLLGLAFHPDYEDNGTLYVSYSEVPSGRQFIVASYQRSADNPNRADPESAIILLDVYHEGNNHYGGMLEFGPLDGYLYVSTGDGGGAYDPLRNAQDLSTLLGAILRLDVDNGDPYAIPADNPFVGVDGARDEIWAYGLRNPWRFSFDQLTGDMYIGDVGQETWEEINVYPVTSEGGKNFGWPVVEGFDCVLVAPECDPEPYVPPAVVIPNTSGTACSITGGYVHRGNPNSPLYGQYIYGDFCSGIIWSMSGIDTWDWQNQELINTEINISSFGVDVFGEIYITDLYAGRLYKLVVLNENPAPFARRVTPTTIPAGSESCLVTLDGFNLRPDSVVTVNGEPRETIRSGPTNLSVWLTSSDVGQPGNLAMAVFNPEPGGGESNVVEIEVAGGLIAGGAIANTWARTDQPVRDGAVNRSWMWGPHGMFCAGFEPYADAEGGQRIVQYFDKSRMEINNPGGDPTSIWYVTNGLLVKEMVTGAIQTGNDSFQQHGRSNLNVAGDLDDDTGPTYETFAGLLDRDPLPVGSTIIQSVDRTGNVQDDAAMAQFGVQAVEVAPETGHVVASPFWEFMNSSATVWEDGQLTTGQLFENPYYATGLPISEAYWTTVRVAGTSQSVLVQAFERRVLTYTPSNPDGWQVELGNVGLHYYFWRYETYPYPEPYE